ncbi:hypothetical protein [Methanobacterium sp.]|jgi:hypothetical protein|uniref:hypothetical protein n=1 Tax=Methanobacterium sp. TaxID=2164 RepID=UPI003158083E
MKVENELLTIIYTGYIHFKNQENTNEFAKILLDKGHYFAVQKNSIWVRINEYKEESLEEEIEINKLLGDFIKK